MIICVTLNARSKDELDRLVAHGGYRDYSEAVAVAISNQLQLHSSNSKAPLHVNSVVLRPSETIANPNDPGPDRDVIATVPKLFSAISEDRVGVKIAQLRPDPVSGQQMISVDQWIWGQHNKLLPVKAACRALARLLTRELHSYEGVALSKASSEIALEAVKLGEYLRRLERELGLLRDENLAHGFPRRDAENEDKSRLRFATQFVGNTSSQGVLSGLPSDLKLVAMDAPRGSRILLTENGWKFACMENPILDGLPGRPARKFSDEEIHFLFDHIMEAVPCEAHAFTTVVNLIENGANTPETIDAALGDYLPDRNGRPYSSAFMTTQRAGVVSRLSDLGMLQRVRDGIKVAYVLSEQGRKYFQNLIHRTA
jgi:hypothetical protein